MRDDQWHWGASKSIKNVTLQKYFLAYRRYREPKCWNFKYDYEYACNVTSG